MNPIIVPTDFSKTAENAMWYAAEIAKKAKAKLILLHVYQFPYISSEIPGTVTTFDEIEKGCLAMLEKFRIKIVKKYGKRIGIEYAFRFGGVEQEIQKFTVAKKAALVITGMQGAGYMVEKLFGNTASSLIQKLKCPVITIGKNTKFKSPKTIALAYDYTPVKKQHIKKIIDLAQLFRSQICVVHVAGNTKSLPNRLHATLASKLEKMLGEKNTTFYYIEDNDLIRGLEGFTKDKKADMIAMLPRSHHFLSKLFKEPNSKKMAFHTRVPLLTIHQ